MSDAVAIISVVTSGIVGLGGLASTVWSAGRERTWKSREERTIDLRAVLESVSERFPLAMFAAAHMWEDIAAGRGVTPERRAELDNAYIALLGAGNRLGVRLGHDSPEHASFRECSHAFSLLTRVIAEAEQEVGAGATDHVISAGTQSRYIHAHAKAVEAETAYLNAAAKLLNP